MVSSARSEQTDPRITARKQRRDRFIILDNIGCRQPGGGRNCLRVAEIRPLDGSLTGPRRRSKRLPAVKISVAETNNSQRSTQFTANRGRKTGELAIGNHRQYWWI